MNPETTGSDPFDARLMHWSECSHNALARRLKFQMHGHVPFAAFGKGANWYWSRPWFRLNQTFWFHLRHHQSVTPTLVVHGGSEVLGFCGQISRLTICCSIMTGRTCRSQLHTIALSVSSEYSCDLSWGGKLVYGA